MKLPRSIVIGLAIFLLLRVALVLLGGSAIPPDSTDHEVYHKVALALAQDPEEWVRQGSDFGYRAPLFFVMLAGLFKFGGTHSYVASQVAASVLGVAACFACYVAARNAGGETAGRVAFWLRGLLPNYIVADTYVMSEQLFAICFFALLAVVAHGKRTPGLRHAGLLGLFVALGTLTRESGAVMLVLSLGYLLIVGGTLRARLAAAGLCLFTCVLVLTPWMLRNEHVWGKPLPLSYTSGVNLYLGNNPNFKGEWEKPESPPPAAALWGSPQFERFYRERAVEYIKAHPGRFVANGFIKTGYFLWPRFQRWDMNLVYPKLGGMVTVLSLLAGAASAAILLFGLLAVCAARRDTFWWFSVATMVSMLGMVTLTFGDSRYRDPVDAILLLFLAMSLAQWLASGRAWAGMATLLPHGARAPAMGVVVVVFAAWAWIAARKAGLPV